MMAGRSHFIYTCGELFDVVIKPVGDFQGFSKVMTKTEFEPKLKVAKL